MARPAVVGLSFDDADWHPVESVFEGAGLSVPSGAAGGCLLLVTHDGPFDISYVA